MGRRLKLKANFLPINVNLDTNIFHYDMQVWDEREELREGKTQLPATLHRELLTAMIKQEHTKMFGGSLPVHDGRKTLFVARALPLAGDEGTAEVGFPPLFLRFSIGKCRNCPFFREFLLRNEGKTA